MPQVQDKGKFYVFLSERSKTVPCRDVSHEEANQDSPRLRDFVAPDAQNDEPRETPTGHGLLQKGWPVRSRFFWLWSGSG
jgi:hypothetical protein